MARKAAAPAAPEREERPERAEAPSRDSVSVHHPVSTARIRTYSRSEHGDGFIRLAEQFARKVGGIIQ